jgi:competence protein ComEC
MATALVRPLVPLLPAHRNKALKVARFGLWASAAKALEHRRLFVLLPIAIICGLIAYTRAGAPPDPVALTGIASALLIGIIVCWRSIVPLRMLALASAFWLGFSLLAIHGALFGTAMLHGSAYGTYEARVDEIISGTEEGARIIISAISPVAPARALPIRRARIAVKGPMALEPGDIIRAPIRFYPVPGPVLPGGFDSQFHGYFDGIGAFGNATGALETIIHGNASAPERMIEATRRGIAQRVDAALPQPSAGIARAIINGDQSAVTEAARRVMSTAGLAHVLSISGLHLTLVAGGVFATLRLALAAFGGLAARVSVKQLAAIGGIGSALLYYSISGGNVAALRSTIMIVLVLGAVIFGRRALTMRNVAIAALIVLVVDPASVFRPSFQLSFAAVTALVGAFETGHRTGDRDRSAIRQFFGFFGGLMATSLVAGAATLLFSAYHFQQTSPLGVVGNLVSLPLVSFVMMPSALFAVLAMPFGFEGIFLKVMGWSIDRMIDIAALISGWSVGIDASPLLTPLALVIGLAALGWFAFFFNRWRLLGPALAIPAVLLLAMDAPPDVVIADTTQAVALRTDEGLQLIAGKPDSFAVTIWAETYGQVVGDAAEGVARCDSIGCIAKSSRGFTMAIIRDPAGFAEDCTAVDLVVTRRDAPLGCRSVTMVIDADDLARSGTHWLRWIDGQGKFEIRPAMVDLNRPWRAARW